MKFIAAKSDAGTFIRQKCSTHPCPCIGLDATDGKTLVLDSGCNHMFYFNHHERMVHVTSGRCVKTTPSNTLMLSTDNCDERFVGDGEGKIFPFSSPSQCIGGSSGGLTTSSSCSMTFEFVSFVEPEFEYSGKRISFV